MERADEAMIEIILPWPDRALSPNASKRHWRSKQAAKVAARDEGFTIASQAQGIIVPCGPLQLNIVFHPPNCIKRDIDNCFSSLKAHIDGICLAFMIDDAQFRRVVLEWGDVVEGGRVIVGLEEIGG